MEMEALRLGRNHDILVGGFNLFEKY